MKVEGEDPGTRYTVMRVLHMLHFARLYRSYREPGSRGYSLGVIMRTAHELVDAGAKPEDVRELLMDSGLRKRARNRRQGK